ncbi:MAG: selenium cofactor biosynthesis protein YqeC [Eubacterium sp.]
MIHLSELLELKRGELVTVTGGGGKTSLLECLQAELKARLEHVIITTTTKMYYPENFEGKIILSSSEKEIVRSLTESLAEPACFTAADRFWENKVIGHTGTVINHLSKCFQDRIILNEGDGAKGKSYKFYEAYEPVIPEETTKLVHLIGCDLLDTVMTAEKIHRCPAIYTGHRFDVSCFKEQMLYFTEVKLKNFNQVKTLIVNKADDGNQKKAFQMAEAAMPYFDQVIVASLKERTWRLC